MIRAPNIHDKALYVFTYIWNLKIKTNEYSNQKQTYKDKLVVTNGKREEVRGKTGIGD